MKTTAKVKQLPHNAGIYKFYDADQNLIYVGKAKDLKKRVSNYFTKAGNQNRKTQKLISEIADIEYVVVNTEFDALLLENNLIKESQPKYNILLKDDKTFPHILVTKEPFPRVYATRRIIKNKGEYFGPYASVKAMNSVLDLIRKLYTIRSCKLDLSEKHIQANKYKVCLEYHIGNCKGPCENLQSEEEYQKDIDQLKYILRGNLTEVKNHFKEKMLLHAENLEFEKAQVYKNKTELLEKFQSKSIIVNLKIPNADVVTIISEDKKAYINYLKISNGTITALETFEVSKKLDETDEEILSLIIFNIRDKYQSTNPVVYTNKEIDTYDENIEIKTPQIGDKKKLVELSIKNILFYKKDKRENNEEKEKREDRILKQLQMDLKLKNLPNRIECFDNSNIQGTNPVASMVCFIGGKPAKKEYRHYKIKTVVGPDDFGSMEEIILRRYKRVYEENLEKPDLIIVDGGKGQLNAAINSLKALNIYGDIPIIGIAKRLEEIYYPGDQYPLFISKKSESLKLIQYLRNEAHRFAITFHRDLRSKSNINSALEEVKGIGKSTQTKLLTHFETIKAIKTASIEELTKIVGKQKALLVASHFEKKA